MYVYMFIHMYTLAKWHLSIGQIFVGAHFKEFIPWPKA